MFLFIYGFVLFKQHRKQKYRAVSWQRNSGSGQEKKLGEGKGRKEKSSKKTQVSKYIRKRVLHQSRSTHWVTGSPCRHRQETGPRPGAPHTAPLLPAAQPLSAHTSTRQLVRASQRRPHSWGREGGPRPGNQGGSETREQPEMRHRNPIFQELTILSLL